MTGIVPIAIGFDLWITVAEISFLRKRGVPASKAMAIGAVDLIPYIDLIPWCTLTVLDKEYNVRVSYMSGLFR